MSAFDLTAVTLANGVDAALALVPAVPGVGQILAEGERNLVIGRPANLRKWAAGHLGRARAPKPAPGKLPPRPPTDLTPIAAAVAYVATTSPFAQRLAYERVMARYVPLAKRRDLKRPAFLRLAPDGQGFPHLLVQPSPEGGGVFGPFRDSRAATRARDALYKHFRVRPCDFDFQAPPVLAASVAGDMARALDGGAPVPEVPAWVRRVGARSLVVDRTRSGLEIHGVDGGRVVGDAVMAADPEALADAVDRLAWTPSAIADDTAWLNSWRHGKRTGIEVPIADGDAATDVAARIRKGLEAITSSK